MKVHVNGGGPADLSPAKRLDGPDRPSARGRCISRRGTMLVTMLRVGSVRFTAYYFASLVTALHATGRDSPGWIALAASASAIGCLAIELLNRATDEREDRINNPLRCRLCDEIGYARLRRTSHALFAAAGVLGAGIWWATSRRWGVLLLIGLAVFIMYNYSAGLRLKRRRWAVLAVLGLPFVFPFVLGWAAYAPLRELPAGVLFLPLFAFTLSGAKDITDVDGDRQRDYRSVFVQMLGHPARYGLSRHLLLLLAAPYIVLAAMVALGVAPARLLLLIVLLPVSSVYVLMCRLAASAHEKAVAREWMYQLLLAAELSTFLLVIPSPRLTVVFAATVLYWIAASRLLHWRPGLTLEHVTAARRILDRCWQP